MTKIGKATKKKRVSKKNKTSWRKHVDINDVEDFLDEQRLEERLGKSLEAVPDHELFVVDTAPSTQKKLLSKKEKRQALRDAPLKCLSLLKPHTKVPDPISKRNRVRTKEERKNTILKKKEAERRAKGIFKKKDLQAAKDRQLDAEKRNGKPLKYEFGTDIWNTDTRSLRDVADLDQKVDTDDWITGDTERHLLHERGKVARHVPGTIGKRPSIIPTIELPHPGMSYNPSFEDHQDLLRLIAENEKKIIKEEEHLKRVTSGMFRKVTVQQRDQSWMTEMSEGLPKPDEPQHDDNSDGEFKSLNPPVQNKKKTLQQRRKQKEQLEMLEKRRKLKEEKRKGVDLDKLRFINRQIEKANAKAKMLHEKRVKKAGYKLKEAKRLGSNKFEEPDIDFNMGSDLTGNLRAFKVEGNLLNDRFKSLQKRSIIEPRSRQVKKKVKVKKYTKPGYKADWKTTVARASFKLGAV